MEEDIKYIKEMILRELEMGSLEAQKIYSYGGFYKIKLRSGIKLHCFKTIISKVSIPPFNIIKHKWADWRFKSTEQLDLKIYKETKKNL